MRLPKKKVQDKLIHEFDLLFEKLRFKKRRPEAIKPVSDEEIGIYGPPLDTEFGPSGIDYSKIEYTPVSPVSPVSPLGPMVPRDIEYIPSGIDYGKILTPPIGKELGPDEYEPTSPTTDAYEPVSPSGSPPPSPIIPVSPPGSPPPSPIIPVSPPGSPPPSP